MSCEHCTQNVMVLSRLENMLSSDMSTLLQANDLLGAAILKEKLEILSKVRRELRIEP